MAALVCYSRKTAKTVELEFFFISISRGDGVVSPSLGQFFFSHTGGFLTQCFSFTGYLFPYLNTLIKQHNNLTVMLIFKILKNICLLSFQIRALIFPFQKKLSTNEINHSPYELDPL